MADSDSDWEPPQKRRKLNNSQAKSKRKKKTRKTKPLKCKTRKRRTNNYDSSIEILSNKPTKKASKSKKKISKCKKRKPSTKKSKPKKRKQTKPKLKAMHSNINTISNMDALICGFYRTNISNTNQSQIIPTDITSLIRDYQKNILYINVNFVWTHKYQCCTEYKKCKYLKESRGKHIFERDPNNRFDGNAIKILTHKGKHIGHMPRDTAECLAPLMDQNKIALNSVGGVKNMPCREMVEIVPLVTLTEQELTPLKWFLEKVAYDQNRYVFS